MVKSKLMDKHFLASEAWADFQQAQGLETIAVEGKDWSYLAIVESHKFNSRLYCPKSPTFSSAKGLRAALTDLESQARQRGMWFVRVEPDGQIDPKELIGLGYHRVKDHQPSLTWILDLSPSEDKLIASMKQANRNLYRNYQKKGLKFEQIDDPKEIKHLVTLLKQVSEHNSVKFHPPKYFENQACSLMKSNSGHLFHVTKDGKILAASLVFDDAKTRYYAHAAADYNHRKSAAGTVLLLNMIIDAKRRGLKYFDFYGVTDSENPDHPWYGFTRFKQSFGGQFHHYLGTWEKPIKPLPYWLYRQMLKVARLLKK